MLHVSAWTPGLKQALSPHGCVPLAKTLSLFMPPLSQAMAQAHQG